MLNFFYKYFNIPQFNKTFNVGIPDKFYSEDCAKAYIRGCLDGDGTISKNGNSFSILSASKNLIFGICDIYKKYTGITIPHKLSLRYNKEYPVAYSSDLKARNFLNWIYSGPGFKLGRKFERYKNYNN